MNHEGRIFPTNSCSRDDIIKTILTHNASGPGPRAPTRSVQYSFYRSLTIMAHPDCRRAASVDCRGGHVSPIDSIAARTPPPLTDAPRRRLGCFPTSSSAKTKLLAASDLAETDGDGVGRERRRGCHLARPRMTARSGVWRGMPNACCAPADASTGSTMADDVMAHLARPLTVDRSRSVVLEPTLPSAASPHTVCITMCSLSA